MTRKPSHPGALLRNIILPETELTISALAQHCGVSRNTLSKIVNERTDITEDMAMRLSRALGSSPQFWLNMQAKHNLWKLSQDKKTVYKKITRVTEELAGDIPF